MKFWFALTTAVFLIFAFTASLILLPRNSLALRNCNVSGSSFNTGDSITFTAEQIQQPSQEYKIQLLGTEGPNKGKDFTIATFVPNSSSITKTMQIPAIESGKYDVQMLPSAESGEFCSKNIQITNGGGGPPPSGANCSGTYSGSSLTVKGSGFDSSKIYSVFIDGGAQGGAINPDSSGSFTKVISIKSLKSTSVITVKEPSAFGNTASCGFVGLNEGDPGKNPCATYASDPKDPTKKIITSVSCPTAIGNISADPQEFAGKILGIATGLAGGIALILMVIGSIRVLTSTGDQQKLAGGRDMIVAAVAGLLFLIFSVLILRFIGIQILGL